jgi:hypothetical protein
MSPEKQFYENLNCKQLAQRLGLPESWVRNHVWRDCADKIPHVKLGGKVIFEWGCEALNEWWARHRVGYEKKTVPDAERTVGEEARVVSRPGLRMGTEQGRGARLAHTVGYTRSKEQD